MEIVTFQCPHCGDGLEAYSQQVGQTHPCPNCNGLVQLQGVTPKQMATAGLVVGGLSILAAILGYGGDD